MRRSLPFLAALIGAVVIAWLASLPPMAKPADAPAGVFSAGRAMSDVQAIAAKPHPAGSPQGGRVRAYLAERLQGLGLTLAPQPFALDDKARQRLGSWGAAPAPEAQGVNLVALLPGRDRAQPAVALMAHYDTVAGSPGAADDSAGVAAILEIVRILKAAPRQRDVMVVLTDAEEVNLDGARAFFRAHPWAQRVGVVVNLEARGGAGRAVMFETGPDAGGLMSLFRDRVRRPSAHSLAVAIYRLMPNSSDFTIAAEHGVPGFNFAFMGGAAQYHSPSSTPAALSQGSLQHLGDQALDLTRGLVAAPALPARAPDVVFSDLFGMVLVLYPAWAGWLVAAAAAGLLTAGAVRAWRAGALSLGAAFAGAARALGLLVVAGATLQLANRLSGAGPQADYFDRLAALGRLELQAAALGLAALVAALCLTRRPAGPVHRSGSWFGALALAVTGVVVLQAYAPTASPPIAWPVLAACLSFTVWAPWRPWAAMAIAALAGGQALALAHLAFLGVGADLPAAMGVFVLLLALLTWPLAEGLTRRPAAAAALVCACVGVAVALWVRLDPPADTVPSWRRAQVQEPAGTPPG